MPWIRYRGSLDRVQTRAAPSTQAEVEAPRWHVGYVLHEDGLPGLPRMTPVQVPQEARDALVGDGHPEWEDCDAPEAAAVPESLEG